MTRTIPIARAVIIWHFTHDGRVRRVSVLELGVDPLPPLYCDSAMEYEDRFAPDCDGACSPDWAGTSHRQRLAWAQSIRDTMLTWGCPPHKVASAFTAVKGLRPIASRVPVETIAPAQTSMQI